MEDKNLLLLVGLLCLTLLECVALLTGLDGQIFFPVIGVIAALVGYTGKAVQNGMSNKK